MSKGGYRPNSGRKKGSVPWNKGIPMSEDSKQKVSLSKKGTPAWNKGVEMPQVSLKMIGNRNGHGNKGRILGPDTLLKMSIAKIGRDSNAKGSKRSENQIRTMSIARRKYLLDLNPNYDYSLDSKTKAGNKRIRRERLKRFGGSHSVEEWEEVKSMYSYTCPACFRKEPEIKLTRDHILSLSNGGSDDIENIQPLCVRCNSRKATKTIKY